ncbi:hypothetical protein PRIPAC_73638, partial [Pristionchus pacificus]
GAPICDIFCPFGQKCVMETVFCKKAPCPQKPLCRPIHPVNKTCSKKNEVWDDCFHGCEATCQERLMICTMQCGSGGCQCATDLIRDETTGECVPAQKCPNKCASNEVYDRCFHGCEATCDQPNPTCTEQCGPGGCRCTNDFVRDTNTKKCVQSSVCPQSIN